MKVLEVGNVNEAYNRMINDALSVTNGTRWRRIPSRVGRVLEYKTPVTTVYLNPWERVLFDPERDANPFFHLMESLWILAGRDDVGWIKWFNKNISQFSDDGYHFHGAYGHRLRHGVEQISSVINHLIQFPDSRRAVLAMWQPVADLNSKSKDIPCNTHIYFKIRENKLHMTVCCRSNDMIWGAYGANAVQFSILQEYIAAHVDAGIGTYTQISDSFHIYEDNPVWQSLQEKTNLPDATNFYWQLDRPLALIPLIESTTTFDEDLKKFFRDNWELQEYFEPFFTQVAYPMRLAWDAWKIGQIERAISLMHFVKADDWKIAGETWLMRRKMK